MHAKVQVFLNRPWSQMILLFGKTKALFGQDTARKKSACFCDAIKCNLMELPTRSTSHPFVVRSISICACTRIPCVLHLSALWRCSVWLVYMLSISLCGGGSHHWLPHLPPPPFPPFSTVLPVWQVPARFPFRVGFHGWVARICQPWERFPSRSWLPIVEACGCFRHPTSTLRGSC